MIETHGLKVTDSPQLIVDNIDYINVNISYVRGVTHNVLLLSFSLTTQAAFEACSWPFSKDAGSTSQP